jgi:hypothetical protein
MTRPTHSLWPPSYDSTLYLPLQLISGTEAARIGLVVDAVAEDSKESKNTLARAYEVQ